jgi:hypothetical protein
LLFSADRVYSSIHSRSTNEDFEDVGLVIDEQPIVKNGNLVFLFQRKIVQCMRGSFISHRDACLVLPIDIESTEKMLGCCIPRDSSKQTNKMINEALERDRKEMNAESKLLLLGKKRRISSRIMTKRCISILRGRRIGQEHRRQTDEVSGTTRLTCSNRASIDCRIIFHENGYTTEECLRFKPVIFSNTIQSMLAIIHALSRLQIPFADANRKVTCRSETRATPNMPLVERRRTCS